MKNDPDPDSEHLVRSRRAFQKRLLIWYNEHRRNLPWRRTRNAYRIWISEVMLQQTQICTVIPYYLRFIKRFPNVSKLAKADLQEVLKCWEGLGYYRRAMYLHQSAKIIMSEHRGLIPDSSAALSKLPGFGAYTTGAVLSIAFNQAYPAIDGNVLRVFSRLFAMVDSIQSARVKKKIHNTILQLLPEDHISDFNQSLMELGALICVPKNPQCTVCPVKQFCQAYRYSDPNGFPVKKLKQSLIIQPVAIAVIIHRRRCLIARRPGHVILPNLWEFPGGKILPGETPDGACIREVREETGIKVCATNLLSRFTHHYSHYSVDLHFYECQYLSGKIRTSVKHPLRWVRIKDLHQYPFPKSTLRVIQMLLKK